MLHKISRFDEDKHLSMAGDKNLPEKLLPEGHTPIWIEPPFGATRVQMLDRVENLAGQYQDIMVLDSGKEERAAAWCKERGWKYHRAANIFGCEAQCVVLIHCNPSAEYITRARNMLILIGRYEELKVAVSHSEDVYQCEKMSDDSCEFDFCSDCAMKNIETGRKNECSMGHQLIPISVNKADWRQWELGWDCKGDQCCYKWSPDQEPDQDVVVWRCEQDNRKMSDCPYTGTKVIDKIPWGDWPADDDLLYF